MTRLIANTTEPTRHPWPADCYVQGGSRGVVFRDEGGLLRLVAEMLSASVSRHRPPALLDDATLTRWHQEYRRLST
jgi:hypothetical protein